MKSKKQVRRSINKSKKFRGKSMKGGDDMEIQRNPTDQMLYNACFSGNPKLLQKALEQDDVDVNANLGDGEKPLHVACDRGHKDVVAKLIELEADVNARDNDGKTPLHTACWQCDSIKEEVLKDIIKMLIANDADTNAKDDRERTPRDIAEPRCPPDIVALLPAPLQTKSEGSGGGRKGSKRKTKKRKTRKN